MAKLPPPLPIAPDLSGKSSDWVEGFIEAAQIIAGMIQGDIDLRESGAEDKDPAGVSALLWIQGEVDELIQNLTGLDPRTGIPKGTIQ